MKKRILIFLLCGIAAVSLVMLVILVVNQETRREPMGIAEYHKNTWIDLLTKNDEVLPYLEQLYIGKDYFEIVYRDGVLILYQYGAMSGTSNDFGEITSSVPVSVGFTSEEWEVLEGFFKQYQWYSIDLYEQKYIKSHETNEKAERKVLEVTSELMNVDENFFTASIVHFPKDKIGIRDGEEIFPSWYYEVYFET